MTLSTTYLLLRAQPMTVVILLILAALAFMWGKRYFETSYWVNGRIPPTFGKTKGNLVEILIALSVNVMKLQHDGFKKKQGYLYDYVKKFDYFEDRRDFQNSLRETLKLPLKSASIVQWINKHYPNENSKLNIAHFVAGLCFQDGDISPREMKYLHTLTRGLKIAHHFDAIVGTYQQKYEKRKQQQTRSKVKRRNPDELAYKILEIQPTKDFNLIKKAYRKLVKIHHPDRLTDASDLEIEMAKDRFIEIQKAYEILEKRYG